MERIEEFVLDDGFSAGLMHVRGNFVVETCPVFARFRGKSVESMLESYKEKGRTVTWRRLP